jgi:hypothetical protein
MGSVGKTSKTSSAATSTGLGKKTVIDSAEPYEVYSEYGGELARLYEYNENYVIHYNGEEAFANTSDDTMYKGELYINGIASTGKGAGTELLARLAEKAYKDKLTLSWVADESGAMKFYEKINVKNFGKVTKSRNTVAYEVKGEKLKKFAEALRNRRKKK